MASNALAVTLILLMLFINGFPTRVSSVVWSQTPPSVQHNPAALNFRKQVVRRRSTPKTITITNVGGAPLYINSAVIAGDNSKDFAISKDGCSGKQVAPGRSCLIGVIFTPTHLEDRNGKLVLTDNAPDSPQSVSLTGTGINSIDVPPF